MNEETKNAIVTAVREIFHNETNKLKNLYSLPLKELSGRERDELIKMSINLPFEAQKKMETKLENVNVPYVHTIWLKISEELPQISYTYIDWQQINNKKVRKLIDKAYNDNVGNVKKWCMELKKITYKVLSK